MMRKKHGFSLMEIMISIGVLSVLVGTAVPLASNMEAVIKIRATDSEMKNLQVSLLSYFRDTGTFPIAAQGLTALQIEPSAAAGTPGPPYPEAWNGPYISGSVESITADSWVMAYQYSTFQGCPQDCTPDSCTSVNNNCVALTNPLVPRGGALYNLSFTQTAKLHSYGTNRVDDSNTVACATTAPCGDDLFINMTSVNDARELQSDTLARIEKVMGVAHETRLIRASLYDELADNLANRNEAITCNTVAINTLTAEINYLNSASNNQLNFFHAQDQWGNPLLWHDQTRQFYSVGPNRIDDTCGSATIQAGDIAGSF